MALSDAPLGLSPPPPAGAAPRPLVDFVLNLTVAATPVAAPKTPSDLFLRLDTTTTYQFLSDDTLPALPARLT